MVAEAGPIRDKPNDKDGMEQTAEFKNILKEVEQLGLFKALFAKVIVS